MLGTIAVMFVLSFFAAMFLHNHAKPRIIGEISQADVSDVSDVAVDFERYSAKSLIKVDLKRWDIRGLLENVLCYHLTKVVSVEAIDSDDVVVRLGVATSKNETDYALEREGACWKVTSTAVHALH